jgi:hypothetical protein
MRAVLRLERATGGAPFVFCFDFIFIYFLNTFLSLSPSSSFLNRQDVTLELQSLRGHDHPSHQLLHALK